MKKELLIGLTFSVVFSAIFLRDVVVNINKPLAHEGDIAFSYFTLQHGFEKLSQLDIGSFYDTRMFYPNKNTLTFGHSELTESIIGLPVYLLTKDVFISANFVLIVNVFLSIFAMYLLVYKLTKSIGGSAVAGLVYTFNPYVMAHFPYHIVVVALQWIALSFLFTEKLLEKITWKRAIILALLVVIQLASFAYYAYFLAVTLPIYVFLRLRYKKLSSKIFLNKKIAVALILMILLGGIYIAPYLVTKSQLHFSPSLDEVSILSTHLSDFLFTTPRNLLYGGLNDNPFLQKLRDPWVVIHYSEHSLFPGIVPFILFITGTWFLIRKKYQEIDKKIVITYLLILLLCFILSLGPYIYIGETKIPWFYLLLHNFVPFTNSLSAPSRFMVIGFLAFSVLCGFGWKYIEGFLGKRKKIILVVILIFITLEYFQKPLEPYQLKKEVKTFYSWLDSQKGIKVIAEIPMANGFPDDLKRGRSLMADSQYLLYGVYHHKKMVNGYNSFIPQDSIGLGLALMNFPSKNNLALLRKNGVDTVIVHTDEYLDPSGGAEVLTTLKKLGARHLYSEGFIHAFSID